MISRLRIFWPLLVIAVLSAAAWIWSFDTGAANAYNDARAHLNIPRLVVDNQQTGLAQLGTVWLPLQHILMLPFIWIDWMWQSGLSGAIVSMASFIAIIGGLYVLVKDLTGRKLAGVMAGAVAALNLNLLYLQTTALTEPLYVALLTLSVMFTVKYVQTRKATALLLAALFAAAQIVTRYDGWFVAFAQMLTLGAVELRVFKYQWRKALGHVLLFVVPVAFCVALWLLWNAVLFGSPLYSFTGPNSAKAQQAVTAAAGQLATQGNWAESARMFAAVATANVGAIVAALGAAGWTAYTILRKPGTRAALYAAGAVLGSVAAFNVLALYLGFSTITVPTDLEPVKWFNTRYGIVMLPLLAVGVGLAVACFRKWLGAALVAVLLALQIPLTLHGGIITLNDGTKGISALALPDGADYLGQNVRPGESVVMSFAHYSSVAHQSGLDLKQFIHEGVSRTWPDAVGHPQDHAEWILMSRYDTGDPVHKELVARQKSDFLKNYELVHTSERTHIYKRK